MPADRTAAIDRAHKLLLLSLFNPEAKEALSAFRKARALIAQQGIGQAELLGAGTAKNWGIEDFMRAAERGKEVVNAAREALSAPEVQNVVNAGRELVTGVVGMIRKRRTGT